MPGSPTSVGERTRRRGRMAAGAAGVVVAAVYLFEARGLRFGTLDAPGPGIFPVIVGVLFAMVSIAVFLEAFARPADGGTSFPAGPDLVRLLAVAAAFAAYVALLGVFGLPLSTVLFVAFYARLVGKVPWPLALGAGIAVAAVVWLVFGFLLEVRLPRPFWS